MFLMLSWWHGIKRSHLYFHHFKPSQTRTLNHLPVDINCNPEGLMFRGLGQTLGFGLVQHSLWKKNRRRQKKHKDVVGSGGTTDHKKQRISQ